MSLHDFCSVFSMNLNCFRFRFLQGFFSAVLGVLFFVGSSQAATIVLDPGHGGEDAGGVPGQRYVEKRAALDVALRVGALLKAAGHQVILTRSSDVFVELSERVAIANRTSAKAVFVSIHFNSAPNVDAHGIETYYYNARGARLATAIHQKVVAATGEEDRGVRRARFYVLRHNRRTAALAELGFLTNPKEGARVERSKAYRQKLANAVAGAVLSVVR